jgi:alpha-D-ribose 1-methylphosphonate 5-phosphate C-P lyase
MTNILHDYPELLDVAPSVQTPCTLCGGTGWRESHIDEVTGLGHGSKCIFCSGLGYVWTEGESLSDQAAEARRRLTRARYLP